MTSDAQRRPSGTEPDDESVAGRLNALVDGLVARRSIHHAVVAIERGDGELRWAGAAGTASPGGPAMHVATPVYLTSVVKPYTATVILQLWERGSIDLDEPMATYLPPALIGGLHRLDGVDHTGTITVRQLLGHTSGLPDYFLGKPKGGVSYAEQIMTGDVSYTISDVADRVRDMTPFFPPQDPSAKRQRARYSDTNYQLLGAIVEAVTGSAFHQVVDEQILRPLDRRATEFAGHPRRRTAEVPATMWAGKTPLDIPLAMRSLGPDGGLIGTAAEAITSCER